MRAERVLRRINQYGTSVEIIAANSSTTQKAKAFIQPLRYKTKDYIDGKCIERGSIDPDVYTYIGPSNIRIDTFPFGTKIYANGDSYIVKRAEKICAEDEIIYIWAILQKYIEE